MSEVLEIVVGVAVVMYVIGRQLVGEPLRGKKVVVLPIVLTVIGVIDLSGNKERVKPVDIAFLALGAAVVAGIGLALGRITRLESRNGALWGQLPVKGLWLWLLLIVSRVLIMAIADGADAKVAASTSSILLMLGINRLAQAAVILPRAMSAGTAFAPEKDGRQLFTGLTTKPDSAGWSAAAGNGSPVTTRPAGTDWPALGRQAAAALADHHRNHEERHDHHDDRHHDRDRRRDRDHHWFDTTQDQNSP
jgi:hypothetical protein